MKHWSGFTLLIVLIFLQVFALLTLNCLSQAVVSTRANFNQYQAGHLLQLTQLVLSTLEKQSPRSCLVSSLPAANLAQQSLSWWQTHACRTTRENKVFYYIFEWLGRDQCCFIKQNAPDEVTSVAFYRLSVFVTHRHTDIVLQSTSALSDRKKSFCKAVPHFIALGWQMYREIK